MSEFIEKKKIGQIFLEMGLVNEAKLKAGLERQYVLKKRIGEILVDANYITEDDVAKALSIQFNLKYIDLSNFILNEELLAYFSYEDIKTFEFLPVKKLGNMIICVIHDPTRLTEMEILKAKVPFQLKYIVASKSKLLKVLNQYIKQKEEEIKKLKKPVDDKKKEQSLETEKQNVSDGVEVEKESKTEKVSPLTSQIEKKLSDVYFEKLKKFQVPCNIFLSSGVNFKGGILQDFDDEVLYLKDAKQHQLIDRKSISAISFVEPVTLK